MEITYDLIIKTLTKSAFTIKEKVVVFDDIIIKSKEEFIIKAKTTQSINAFPNKFKSLLNNSMYRYSVTIYDSENNNISFWSSLLSLLDINSTNNSELDMIKEFQNKIVKINNNRTNLIQAVVNILDVNFIILDFSTLDIFVMYKDEFMNPYKQTFIFAKYNDFWGSIKSNENCLFDINTIEIKNILNNDCNYYDQPNKKVNIKFDILDIIMDEKIKYIESSTDNIFVKSEKVDNIKKSDIVKVDNIKKSENIKVDTVKKPDVIKVDNIKKSDTDNLTKLTEYDVATLNKLKIVDLTNICDTQNISYKKKSSKNDLINLIINNKSNEKITSDKKQDVLYDEKILTSMLVSELTVICDKLQIVYKKKSLKKDLIKYIIDSQLII